MSEELIISIGQELLSKKIPFCIYKFPHQSYYNLAIDSHVLFQTSKNIFWISPFVSQSNSIDIQLNVVEKSNINQDFYQYIQSLSKRDTLECPIPQATTQRKYYQLVQKFIRDIQAGKLKKAILSRIIVTNTPEYFQPIKFFKKLSASYPNAFTYIFFHPSSGLWTGAAPELLLKKVGNQLSIMSLAGTQEKNDSKIYHWTEKEKEEHWMVGEHIESIFSKHQLTLLHKEGPHTSEAGKVVHLQTDYIYEDLHQSSIKELIKDLHPTPAVGGLPAKEAVEYILQHEKHDRAYYCGIIGETNYQDNANLYVNLRCMQIGEKQIALYVGGGITASSIPDDEWNETILKSQTMTQIINALKEDL
ncbi:MAG: isochorismate synthase [Chitinophagales bacterium]|nr:isochorismate synthase [Chitinophagales bacterium]